MNLPRAWSCALWNSKIMPCLYFRFGTWARHCHVHGILFVSLAARFRSATRSTTLVDGLTKFRAAHNSDRVTLHALSTAWEESVLHRSVAFSKMEAHNFVCRLHRPSPTPSLFYLHTKCKGQRQPYFAQWNKHVASHDTLRSQRQRFLARSADIVSRKSLPPSAMEVVPLALD